MPNADKCQLVKASQLPVRRHWLLQLIQHCQACGCNSELQPHAEQGAPIHDGPLHIHNWLNSRSVVGAQEDVSDQQSAQHILDGKSISPTPRSVFGSDSWLTHHQQPHESASAQSKNDWAVQFAGHW